MLQAYVPLCRISHYQRDLQLRLDTDKTPEDILVYDLIEIRRVNITHKLFNFRKVDYVNTFPMQIFGVQIVI